MAHLAAGAHFQLAVEMQAKVGLGENIAPFLRVLADQIVHFDPPAPRRRAKRPAGDGADMLLELRGLRAVDRPMSGIMDARGEFIDDKLLDALRIARHKQFYGDEPDVIQSVHDLARDLPGSRLRL